MEHATDKIDEDVLALLFLTSFRERKGDPWRAWKSHHWEALDRLFQKGYISDLKSKAKSVGLSEEGFARAKKLFESKYEKRS